MLEHPRAAFTGPSCLRSLRLKQAVSGYHPNTMTHAKPDEEQPQQQPQMPRATSRPPDAPADPAPRGLSRLAVVVPSLISLVALGIASWALVRTSAESSPPPTAQQIADAKGSACAAYTRVRTAVALQSQVDVGSDPNAAPLVAVNARLAMTCLLYTSPSPRDRQRSRMPSSA